MLCFRLNRFDNTIVSFSKQDRICFLVYVVLIFFLRAGTFEVYLICV
jgi:hypothetical protein